MKKRIVAVMLCSVLAMSSLTACGAGAEVDTDETVEEEVEETEEEAEEEVEEDADGACSDESFAALQEAYASLSEEVELVENYYMENSDIPQDDQVEAALSSAHDYMDQVGEISQEEITEAEAAELAQSMIDVSQQLVKLAEALDIMAEDGAEEAEAEDEACSDETFAELQEAYAGLQEIHTTVSTYYLENDDVAQDDNVEETLNKAQDYLDQVGEISQEEITEAEAAELAQSMLDVASALETVANAIAQ